jgi:hypothetical protein
MIGFEFCYHAELKLKERRISKTEVGEILTNPENVFLDVDTGNLVAVGMRKSIKDHKLIIAYSSGERIKVVTVIDTSKMEIIKNREEKGRWIKIK